MKAPDGGLMLKVGSYAMLAVDHVVRPKRENVSTKLWGIYGAVRED